MPCHWTDNGIAKKDGRRTVDASDECGYLNRVQVDDDNNQKLDMNFNLLENVLNCKYG